VVEPPLYTYYACHSKNDSPWHPRYLLWSDVPKQGTHPEVLIAYGTHEHYYKTPMLQWPPSVPRTTEYSDHTSWHYPNAGGACDCKISPFFIGDFGPLDTDEYDTMEAYDSLIPGVLNLGNGDFPNPETPWLLYGGTWGQFDGPNGPLGAGAARRFKEHTLRPGGDGDLDMVGFYRIFETNHPSSTTYLCSGGGACEDGVRFQALGFPATAAFVNSQFVDGSAPSSGDGSIFSPKINLRDIDGANDGAPVTVYIAPGEVRNGGPIHLGRSARVTLGLWYGLSGKVVIR